MSTILDKIYADKKEELQETQRNQPLSVVKNRAGEREDPIRDVCKALREEGQSRIIAEIKPRSPFKGVLRPDIDPIEIGRTYEQNGASAISVLTESRHFGGSIDTLVRLRDVVSIPLLRKDFIFDPYQVHEAKAYGADFFLLIATWLGRNQMEDLKCLGEELGLTALVETHSEEDVEKAFAVNAKLLGINNRDLKRGVTDLNIARRLLKMAQLDPEKTLVCESGIRGRDEIEEFEGLGAHAFLIGESLMTADDIAGKLKGLLAHDSQPSAQSEG